MFHLDMITVLLSHCISNVLATLSLYFVWTHNKGRFNGVSHWMTCFVLQTMGLMLIVLRGFIPDFISIVLACVLIIAGAIIFYFGLALFLNKKINRAFYYAILGVFFLLYTYFQTDIITRITIFCLTLAFINFQAAKILFSSTDIKMQKSYRLTANVSIFVGIVYLLMAALYQEIPISGEYYNVEFVRTVMSVISQMVVVGLTFSIIIMLNNKLFVNLEEESLERECILEKFKYLARTDGLTKLFNRKTIEEKLKEEFARSKRYRCKMSVILLDVDNFKNINDTYGHDKGDFVLKKVAQLLKNTLRATDIIGRWGGEEFKIICVETDPIAVWQVAEKLREAILNYNFKLKTPVTVSLGTATLKSDDKINDLLQRADINMYKAKAAGRNKTHPNLKQELILAV